MKRFIFIICTLVILSPQDVEATLAPQSGELSGGFEYGLLASLKSDSNDLNYSEAARLGMFLNRGIPFGLSLEFGLLNKAKHRFTRFGLFSFGKQPVISGETRTRAYYRAELLSFSWKEAGSFDYSPGLEIGGTYAFSAKYGFAFFLKATVEKGGRGNDKSWGQEDFPQGVLWLGFNLLQMNYF